MTTLITAAKHDVIFLENRRTPKIVPKGEKYEPTEAEGRIERRRAATEEEEKTIARGDWVRVNKHGDKPSDSGYKRKKSKVRPQDQTNAGETDVFSQVMSPAERATLLNDEWIAYTEALLAAMTAAAGPSEDGYSGVTHAGIAVVAADTGNVFLAQRAPDETDDPDVAETWEFPGGGLETGEEPMPAVLREWSEEIGMDLPEGTVTNGWRAGEDDHYQGFVYVVPTEFDLSAFTPTDEVQSVMWADLANDHADLDLRPEIHEMDLSLLEVPMPENDDALAASFGDTVRETYEKTRKGREEMESEPTDRDTEPEPEPGEFDIESIPVHGIIAPEEVASGDRRAFAAGAMNKRPLRLPFNDQRVSVPGHDGSVNVGSVDRMMRSSDGMIHWEGRIRCCADAEDLVERMVFFDGRYGVSVDGDQGSLDLDRSKAEEMTIFDQLRASGLTAVAIPAFHEAHVAFGLHPDMPDEDDTLAASLYEDGDMIGGRALEFKRGPGWVTNPEETRRLHAYWTQKGQPGYAKVRWGTSGDFTRAKALIGAKIAANSPEKMRFLNQIIAQWHHDALGYWPGELGKPGNPPDTAENRQRAARHAASLDVDALERDDITAVDDSSDETAAWEAVLVSSVSGNHGQTARPSLSYFHQHPEMISDVWGLESAALRIEEPDEFGFRRTWGYAAEWGVCHVGMDGRCVEPPQTGSDDYPEFHLGRTKTADGYVYTGVLTAGVGHRDGKTILSESPDQAYFDNINNAWAAVRVGENERGIWFSGVLLPKVDEDLITKIEASGQVSGEWKAGAMRACLTVNVPGFPVERPSAEYDEFGNVMAMAASAFGQVPDAPCSEQAEDDPVGDLALAVEERLAARARMKFLRETEASARFADLKSEWSL